jgi:uncharacterized protein YciI
MLYAIIATDHPESLPARRETRPAHLARLEALQAEGRLVLAGPHPAVAATDPGDAGFTGSLVVAEFDDLDAAQAWADADPYVAAGVYRDVVIKPFIRVLPR